MSLRARLRWSRFGLEPEPEIEPEPEAKPQPDRDPVPWFMEDTPIDLDDLRARAERTKSRGAWGVMGADLVPDDWEYGVKTGPRTVLTLLDGLEALAYLVNEEYPTHNMSLAEVYDTWGHYDNAALRVEHHENRVAALRALFGEGPARES